MNDDTTPRPMVFQLGPIRLAGPPTKPYRMLTMPASQNTAIGAAQHPAQPNRHTETGGEKIVSTDFFISVPQ